MQESSFVGIFEAVAKEVLGDKAIVDRKANLFYELYLNRKLELMIPPESTKNPKRGTSAFQTDICICELIDGVKFPRLAIEFKESISTHDILTYSAKAGQHKRIYPCLRYGILVGNEASIPSRFFIHNENLDFFIAAKNYKGQEKLRPLVQTLVEAELAISRKLEEIHFDCRKFDYYRRDIVFRNFGEK